ncbi:MAG: hypothetical protein ACK5RG_12125 [Cyclobacteriaceae bacterium]|jgi:hypothetical protein|nr:hypothetical protein [Flammeovirgaceae bacterium]
MMFGLFGKKDTGIRTNDQVWISQRAKLQAARKMVESNTGCLLVFWFEDSLREFHQLNAVSTESAQVVLAESLSLESISGKLVIFGEHYPLRKKEQALFQKLQLTQVPVLVSLEEPFIHFFGGERTIELMHKMGMQESEVISHAMITRSIENAQKKMEEGVVTERKALSAQEWLQLNAGSLNRTT